MSFVYQESSFKADAKPERDKLLGVIPWFRPSTAVGYSQALTKTWEDYKDETGNNRANRKNFDDSADFIGWYASKGYYQGFEKDMHSAPSHLPSENGFSQRRCAMEASRHCNYSGLAKNKTQR